MVSRISFSSKPLTSDVLSFLRISFGTTILSWRAGDYKGKPAEFGKSASRENRSAGFPELSEGEARGSAGRDRRPEDREKACRTKQKEGMELHPLFLHGDFSVSNRIAGGRPPNTVERHSPALSAGTEERPGQTPLANSRTKCRAAPSGVICRRRVLSWTKSAFSAKGLPACTYRRRAGR